MILHVTEILEVIPFKMKMRFNNGETREVNFENIFEDSSRINPDSVFNRLKDPAIFQKVKLDGEWGTPVWDNLVWFIDYDGQRKLGPLDISPEYLYEMSIPISSEKVLH